MSTIAFSTEIDGYISNIGELVAEIRDEMDDSGYSLPKIYRAIGRAEAIFNRLLRVPQMETETDLTVTNEATDLPANYLSLRFAYQEGNPDKTLRSMSPAGLRALYLGRDGTVQAYAIENMRLIIGPVGNASITLLYYAKVPPLTEASPTNWLLRDYPDLYLHQVLGILFQKTGDRERAADHLGQAASIIEQANAAGRKARWGASPLTPNLVAQVRGTRI